MFLVIYIIVYYGFTPLFYIPRQQGRKLEMLTIDHVERSTKLEQKNGIRVIVILVRSHPGESPASFVCQGKSEFCFCFI